MSGPGRVDRRGNSEPHARLRLAVRPWGLIGAAGAVAGLASILGFFAYFAWFLDLFSHFRVQYFCALSVAALLLLIPRQRRAAAVFGLLAAVNLCTIVPLYFGGTSAPRPHERPMRAMLMNVNTASGQPARVADAVRQYGPDIVVLEEVSARWITELRPVLAAYPHAHLEPREDNFGIALLSRYPFARCRTLSIGDAGVPSVVAEIETPHGRCTVMATHPLPPGGRSYSRWRNAQLAALPGYVRSAGSPVLLLGDLNVTAWSPHFRRLLRDSGLRDSSQGRGVQPTWPTYSPLLWIPIDHCLHSPEIAIMRKEVGPDVGSDHYPLIVDFVLRADGGTNGP